MSESDEPGPAAEAIRTMDLQRSCGPDWLDAELAAGRVVILDGAMGSELEARGVPMHDRCWSAAALLSHPEVVRATHEDYIRAGARVIITNSFAAGRHMLEPAGLGEETVKANRQAAALALAARDAAAVEPVAVAGSLCEWVHGESAWCAPEKLSASLREQAELLAEAGVDLIALEMCQSLARSRLAVEAALSTGLPVWLGASCKRRPEMARLGTFDAPPEDFEALAAALAGSGIAVFNVMHSPIADTALGLETVKRHWSGPLGAYPESGHFVMPNWQFVDIIAPPDLVREAQAWAAAGVQLLGGCCGLGPPHVAALKDAFASARG